MVIKNKKKKKLTIPNPKTPTESTENKDQLQTIIPEIVSDDVDAPSSDSEGRFLQNHAVAHYDAVKRLKIENDYQYSSAVGNLQFIKELKNKVEEYFGPQKDAAYKAWKVSCDQYNKAMNPLKEAESIIKRKMTDYDKLKMEEQKEALKEAEKSGLPAPIVGTSPKVKGISKRKDVSIEVVDQKAFLKAVIDGSVPLEITKLVTIKSGVIKSYVQATGIKEIPGVKITDTVVHSVRGG